MGGLTSDLELAGRLGLLGNLAFAVRRLLLGGMMALAAADCASVQHPCFLELAVCAVSAGWEVGWVGM